MKICIVAHNAYGMMSGDTSKHIGGVENQAAMMARWLSSHGHSVSLITWRENGAQSDRIDGVKVIKLCGANSGIRLVRFFMPRWTSLIRALKRADADIYYQNGAEHVTGQVALWCRRKKKAFIFSTASDMDCRRDPPSVGKSFERWLYRNGVQLADQVIAQTTQQVAELKKAFSIEATILPMPCLPVAVQSGGNVDSDGLEISGEVILVGRISKEKHVELFLKVAEALPDIKFLIVGPIHRDDEYCATILKQAEGIENLAFFGAATKDQLGMIYRRALVLCCTSHFEGFPNTFIEAWSHGIPIVSTVDPNGVLEKHKLGFVAKKTGDFTRTLAKIFDTRELQERIRASGIAYFDKNHSLDNAMRRFETLFAKISSRK